MSSDTSRTLIALKYPFGHASGAESSRFGPGLMQQCHDWLAENGLPEGLMAIHDWVDVSVPEVTRHIDKTDERQWRWKRSAERKYHYSKEVDEAVTNLTNTTVSRLIDGDLTLTVGGDHSQGIATVKSALYSHVVRAIVDKKIVFGNYRDSTTLSTAKQKQFEENLYRNFRHHLEGDALPEQIASTIEYYKILGLLNPDQIQNTLDQVHVIWFDSHGDSNTPRSSDSGNAHGMSLAGAMGWDVGNFDFVISHWLTVKPGNVHILGARALDEEEERLMKDHGVDYRRFDASHLRTVGGPKGQPSLKEAFDSILQEFPDARFACSLDVDGIDKKFVPTTGTAVAGGPSLKDAMKAFQGLAKNPRVLAIDITEASPGRAGNHSEICRARTTIRSSAGLQWAVQGGDHKSFVAAAKACDLDRKLYDAIREVGREQTQNAAQMIR